jgi:hypothetical protein
MPKDAKRLHFYVNHSDERSRELAGGSAGHKPKLVLVFDTLEFGKRGDGLEIGAVSVAFGGKMALWLDQGLEILDSYYVLVRVDGLEEA